MAQMHRPSWLARRAADDHSHLYKMIKKNEMRKGREMSCRNAFKRSPLAEDCIRLPLVLQSWPVLSNCRWRNILICAKSKIVLKNHSLHLWVCIPVKFGVFHNLGVSSLVLSLLWWRFLPNLFQKSNQEGFCCVFNPPRGRRQNLVLFQSCSVTT